MPGSTEDSWEIWVSRPLNKDADVLIKWSQTSFFGGSPTAASILVDGIEFHLFQKCSAEWTVKYALATALSNYSLVKLMRNGEEVEFPKLDVVRPSEGILGDAAKMGRSGGMC